jgi:hypothetical protein
MPLIDSPPRGGGVNHERKEPSELTCRGDSTATTGVAADRSGGGARVDNGGDGEGRAAPREGSAAAGREELRHGDTDLVGDELDLDDDDG